MIPELPLLRMEDHFAENPLLKKSKKINKSYITLKTPKFEQFLTYKGNNNLL